MKKRIEQVSEVLKKQLSLMIFNILPENLGLVTITDVTISKDLKNATIYLSILQKNNISKVLNISNSHAHTLQKELSTRLKTRFTPKLIFVNDDSKDKINRVEDILSRIDNNK